MLKILEKYLYVCLSACRSVRPSANIEPKLIDLVQIRYLVSSSKYVELFFVFDHPSQLGLWKVLFKKLKFRFPKKMALKIFIIFVGFVEHSIKQFDTIGFYQKISEGKMIIIIFFTLREVQY